LFPFDIVKQYFAVPNKIRMSEALLILSIAGLVKVIHIELPYKTAEIIVLKVPWQYVLSK